MKKHVPTVMDLEWFQQRIQAGKDREIIIGEPQRLPAQNVMEEGLLRTTMMGGMNEESYYEKMSYLRRCCKNC